MKLNGQQSGLTLMEVMVALTLGLLLLIGLGAIFFRSSQVQQSSNEFSLMQENATFAFNMIGQDLRMAGFYGPLGNLELTQVPSGTPITLTNDCAGNYSALKTDTAIFGLKGMSSSDAHTALGCVNEKNIIGTVTDKPNHALLLRGAGGTATAPTALVANNLYIQSDPNTGILFKGSSYANLAAYQKRVELGGVEAPIYPYNFRLYYLRPCNRPTGSGSTCQSSDDNGNPLPTLVRMELSGTTLIEIPVAEGIEAMRIFYGIDTDADGATDQYVEQPSAAQFQQAVSARVTLLVRSATPSMEYNDADKSYDLDGDGTAELKCTIAAQNLPCTYKRMVFSQSFQIRNLVQRTETANMLKQ